MNTAQVLTKWAVKRIRTQCVYSDHGIYHTELSHWGKTKQNKTKNPSDFSFSVYAHVLKFQHFSLKGGMYANLIFSFINDDFRLNPLVLGADIFQRRL